MSTPGKEAEELRAGIEKLISEAEYASELDDREAVPAYDLQKLLDDVDARDALHYLEGGRAFEVAMAALEEITKMSGEGTESPYSCAREAIETIEALGVEEPSQKLRAWLDHEDAWDEFNSWQEGHCRCWDCCHQRGEFEPCQRCGHRKCDHYHAGCIVQKSDSDTDYKTAKCDCESFVEVKEDLG